MRLSVIILVLLASFSLAEAYPQFQLVHEAACSNCHLSPAGGGLLADYGRDEAGATISRGGDGRFLHGAFEPPSWFAIGGDFRFATAARRTPTRDTDVLAFPMQADINLRVTRGDLAVAFTAGIRGVARDDHPPALLERLASREHYVAYTFGSYHLRAGRFFPTFGLRLADHTAYTRRFLGFNLYEEPYAVALSHHGDRTEAHLTAFVPQPIDLLGSGARRTGASLLVERTLSDTLVLGAQARGAVSDDDTVSTAGALLKRYFADAGVLLLGELDLQRQTFRGNGPARTQLAAYVGASQWLTRGVLLSSTVHAWEPDLALRSTTRYAFDVSAQYFAWAHVEFQLLLRASSQGGTVEDPGYLSLLQLHYYP